MRAIVYSIEDREDTYCGVGGHFLEGGALYLQDGDGVPTAVYAPGVWLHLELLSDVEDFV